MNDAAEEVILVDADDRPLGASGKLEAHREGAFTARSPSSFTTAKATCFCKSGTWANTTRAACGPTPAAGIRARARRRRPQPRGGLRRRWAFIAQLRPLGTRIYRADVGDGLIEHELVHVFEGRYTWRRSCRTPKRRRTTLGGRSVRSGARRPPPQIVSRSGSAAILTSPPGSTRLRAHRRAREGHWRGARHRRDLCEGWRHRRSGGAFGSGRRIVAIWSAKACPSFSITRATSSKSGSPRPSRRTTESRRPFAAIPSLSRSMPPPPAVVGVWPSGTAYPAAARSKRRKRPTSSPYWSAGFAVSRGARTETSCCRPRTSAMGLA